MGRKLKSRGKHDARDGGVRAMPGAMPGAIAEEAGSDRKDQP